MQDLPSVQSIEAVQSPLTSLKSFPSPAKQLHLSVTNKTIITDKVEEITKVSKGRIIVINCDVTPP